jgi:hypothetical protein
MTNDNDIGKWGKTLFIAMGFLALTALLVGLPLWILWNLTVAPVFGLPYIGFWQAVGLQMVAGLLFKSPTNGRVQ